MNRIKQKPLDAQVFLTPYFMMQVYIMIIFSKKDILLDMGFEIQPHKNNIIKINTVPLQFGDMNLDLFFNDIAENFRENVEDSESLKEIIAKKACKSAIKGGTALQKSDIEYVLGSFFRNMPLKCPHGRPVICKISKREIEKCLGEYYNMIIFGGATATGKTKAGVMLAKIANGEIISTDSMQVYKHMDIGTAKVKKKTWTA